ncbi:MAG: glutamine synthetase family protein [Lachnospiraceae bacterium]|nr:glutamine synthetase family protein [Lachnospiraceae bacterium]
MNTLDDILNLIDEEGVEFIRLQFADIFGNLKNVAITPGQIERVSAGRFSIEGETVFGESADEVLYLKPDLDTFVILPWRPKHGKVGKLICSVVTADGKPYELCSRSILASNLDILKDKGYEAYTDPECEFFLFHTDDAGLATTITHEEAGYMDVGPVDLGENARRDMVLTLEEMGFDIKASHHEKAPGQHEIDFRGDCGVKAADDVMTFKFAVRSVARSFGLHATFMPSPIQDAPGSSMHLKLSLYKEGRNLFNSSEETAGYFAGGIMKYAPETVAFTNPLVNSYKRLDRWKVSKKPAPLRNLVSVTDECGEKSVEVRFPDPSANVYLTIALLLRAGLKGIDEHITPDNSGFHGLPGNLKDALLKSHDSSFVKEVLGDRFADLYISAKFEEWDDYLNKVSDWELERYLLKV